jgi:putative ABC transport system substrate-binding protein
MKRREFITLLGGAAAWPFAARAQQPVKIYRLGYLAPARIPHLIDALLTGLRELGYVEGKNIKIEYRYGGTATLDELAAQLVDLHPDAVITVATPPAIAAKRATTTIPIVMATAGDPVRSGIVASFARPGDNVTGVTLYGSELSAKRVEVLKEAVPRTTPSPLSATQEIPIANIRGRTWNQRLGRLGWAAASSRVWRARAATPPVSPLWSRRFPASGWSCSRRSRRTSSEPASCSIQQRRHT